LRLISASDGAVLEFAEINSSYFRVTFSSLGLDASVRVSSYLSGGFWEFFAEIAAEWKGWSGTRDWSSLEGELTLSATSDRGGHITLTAVLLNQQPFTWRLEGQVVLEAGQLERIAKDAREFASRAIRTA
jgi:hypothetical protein